MKKLILKVIYFASILFILLSCSSLEKNGKDRFPVLKGPYMGQNPPGISPEIFLPGVLSNDSTGAFCTIFSPEGDEFYFVYYDKNVDNSGVLACMKQNNEIWSMPDTLHFTSDTDHDNDMCMSYDGQKIFFRSWRTLADGTKPNDHSWLWYVERERENENWSAAKPFYCGGELVRTGYPSISLNNTLYFTYRKDSLVGIYKSILKDDYYEKPEFVYKVIDSIYTEGDMFVAPDESYMIISCWDHPENIDGPAGDLYITYKKDDGSWTEAINMGEEINTSCGENCPTVTPDGKYFFFNRYCEETKVGNMYWMDAKILDELKPK